MRLVGVFGALSIIKICCLKEGGILMKIIKLSLACLGFAAFVLSGCQAMGSFVTDVRNSAPPANMPTLTPEAECGSLVFLQPGASAVPYLLYYSTQKQELSLTVQHGFPNTLIITDITDRNNISLLQKYPNLPNSPPPNSQLIKQGYWQVNSVTPSSTKPQETDLIVIVAPQNGPFFRTYQIQEKSVNPKFTNLSQGGYFSVFYNQGSCVLETPQFGSDQPTSLYMAVAWQDKCTKLNSPPQNSGSSGGPQAGTVSICPTFGMAAQRSGSLPLVNGLWLDDDGVFWNFIPGNKSNDDNGGMCIGLSGCAVSFSSFGSLWICGSNQICQAANTFTNMAEGDWDFWFVKWDPVKQKLSGWKTCGVPIVSPPNTLHSGAANTLGINLIANSYSYSIYNPYYIWETNNPNKPNPNNPYNANVPGPEPGFVFQGIVSTFSPNSFAVTDPCGKSSNNINLSEGIWNVSP